MPDASASSTCLRCGSDAIIPDAYLVDPNYGGAIAGEVMRAPRALMLKGKERVTMRAQICGVCGHVELFVTDPEALWAAHQEREGSDGE